MPEEPLRWNTGLKWNGTISTNNNNMSENNKISIVIPQTRVDLIHQHLDAVLVEILEFAAELTPQERLDPHTIGVKRGAMVSTFETQMAQNPKCVPGFIELPEKAKDVDAWKIVAAMIAKVNTIMTLLGDTEHVLGSDLLTTYEAFYRFSQECAGQGVAGAAAVVDALKVFFPQGRKAKKPGTPPTA